jgi:thiamine kinase-like enzyme
MHNIGRADRWPEPTWTDLMPDIKTRAHMVRLVGQVGYHIAGERLRRRPRTTLLDVPPSPEALTVEWLTLALCQRIPDAEVTGFELGPRNDGTSARRTLRVTYNAAGRDARLPEAVFTKSAPSFLSRMVAAGARLAQIEASFYQFVRPELDIEAPATLYSAFDPVSHRLMLITDDVTVTRGATFGTALDRRLSRAQAEQVVTTLAALHAHYWNAPLHNMFSDWLRDTHQYFQMLNDTLDASARILSGFERARAVVPRPVYAHRHEVYAALVESQRHDAFGGPTTFLHGDVHPGNWYLTRDGALGLYDWQMCVIGSPARDLAYALTSHLTIEDRRAWEVELLERYRDELATRGVDSPPRIADLFLDYRRQAVYGMFAWLATIGRSPLQPKYQPDEISLANLERIAQACADLDTLDALQDTAR